MNNPKIAVGAALVGAVLVVAPSWNRGLAQSQSGPSPAAPTGNSKPALKLLSPGILSIAVDPGGTTAAGLELQRDGTIIIGATTGGWPESRGIVLRLTSNGRLAKPPATVLGHTETRVSGISTAPDGSIVVVGSGSGQFRLARLRPDGVVDSTFGRQGMAQPNMLSSLSTVFASRALALPRDGRIVVTGVVTYSPGFLVQGAQCATARLNQDGTVDESFGNKGRVLTLLPGRGRTRCSGMAVFVAPGGETLVVGNATYEQRSLGSPHIAVLRYLPSGAPDRQFGREGTGELDMDATAHGAALDSQGRVVVVGTQWLSLSSMQFLVARFDARGNVDQSFGAKGAVVLHPAAVTQQLNAVAVQQDGKIVAVGTFGWHSGGRAPEPGKREQIAVVRLQPNGDLDKSFAGAGLLLMASPRYLWGGQEIAIQPDGKLVIAGRVIEEANDGSLSRSAIVLAKLRPNGTADPEFGRGLETP